MYLIWEQNIFLEQRIENPSVEKGGPRSQGVKEEGAAAGYVHSGHQRAQRNAVVSQRENTLSQEEKGT